MNAQEIAKRLGGGEKDGNGFKCRCPNHAQHKNDDKKPSCKVSDMPDGGIAFYCYTGNGGCDSRSLWKLAKERGLIEQNGRKKTLKSEKSDWKPMIPVPSNAPPPPQKHYELGVASDTWTYTKDGVTLFHVQRFELADGNKEYRPVTWCEDGNGNAEWRYQSVSTPRPLYNLDELSKRPDAPVLVCEGEKSADAAAILYPAYVATTSPHGAKSAKQADWTPLRGRNVTIWQDADDSGTKYLNDVAACCDAECLSVISLDSLEKALGKPLEEGFDAYDALGTVDPDLIDIIPCAIEGDQQALKESADQSPTESPKVKIAVQDKTQIGIARLVAEAFGQGNIIFAHGSFFVWDNKVWRQCNDQLIKQEIISVIEVLNLEVKAKIMDDVLRLMKAELFRQIIFDAESMDTINCNNGELSYIDDKWVLSPHCRESYRLSVLPVNYVPGATAERFEKFLVELFLGDEDANEKKAFIEEMLGNSLVPDRRFEKIAFLTGEGENGKSKLLNVVTNVVGSHNVAAVSPAAFDQPFQMAHLFGKLVNIVPELSAGLYLSDGALKQLASGEQITVQRKFKDPFDFKPYARNWFGTNNMPKIKDTTHGFFRRVAIIEFNRMFRKLNDPMRKESDPLPDLNLDEKLQAVSSGILNVALNGLLRLRRQGYFTEPASSIKAKNRWLYQTNPVKQFVVQECTTGPNCSAASKYLYEAYTKWCHHSGIDNIEEKNEFGRQLTKLGFELCRDNDGRFRRGLQLNS